MTACNAATLRRTPCESASQPSRSDCSSSSPLLQPFNERREQRLFGPGLHPGVEAAQATGIDAVLGRGEFAALLAAFGRDRRVIYTPRRPEVLGEASSSDLVQFDYAPDYQYSSRT